MRIHPIIIAFKNSKNSLRHYLLFLLMGLYLTGNAFAGDTTQYLAFQIFTASPDSKNLTDAFPPAPDDLPNVMRDLKQRIGTTGTRGRQIGFVLGPIALDNTDDQVRKMIADGFNAALATDIAVGFHIDDSMFWGRMKELNKHENIEWLDWKGTPNTGRRLDWSQTPLKIMPQLCVNSKEVREVFSRRAQLIGHEITKGIAQLHKNGREDLFLGVITGWETQIGRDFDSGKYLGYCALTNAGYDERKPPVDLDLARSMIIQEFIGFWTQSLTAAGVPANKVYSHIAFMSDTMFKVAERSNPSRVATTYLQTVNFTPPSAAFCNSCIPGFSTYPQPGLLEQWQTERNKHGNPPWASCEGTAIDPGMAAQGVQGMNMERYLGNLFNHGAVLVNIFGWGVGEKSNPFRKIAESDEAIAAYRKFIGGAKLEEAPLPVPSIPPMGLEQKIHHVQELLPPWIEAHGPSEVRNNMEKLQILLRKQHYKEAGDMADTILKTIEH